METYNVIRYADGYVKGFDNPGWWVGKARASVAALGIHFGVEVVKAKGRGKTSGTHAVKVSNFDNGDHYTMTGYTEREAKRVADFIDELKAELTK